MMGKSKKYYIMIGLINAGIAAVLLWQGVRLLQYKEANAAWEVDSKYQEDQIESYEKSIQRYKQTIIEYQNREEQRKEEQERKKDSIVGTWCNRRSLYTYYPSDVEHWLTTYWTRFSSDGQVMHYGHRNADFGTWERVDADTVVATYTDCSYRAVGGRLYDLPDYSYSVTYVYDSTQKEWMRSTDREEITVQTEDMEAPCLITDFDDYNCPLQYSGDEERMEYYIGDLKKTDYSVILEKRLLELAGDIAEAAKTDSKIELEQVDFPYQLISLTAYDLTGDGKKELFVCVRMSCHSDYNTGALYILSPRNTGDYTILAKNTDFRSGYTEILAPDGTQLVPLLGYSAPSSWKGGVRFHLGYRKDQVVVDKTESYGFHWDLPLINEVNDYQNGIYQVYVARNEVDYDGYGTYRSIEESTKIEEEYFAPKEIPFTGFQSRKNDYPAVYGQWSPFPENWWQDGGQYPEDGEAYGSGCANWIEEAADDDPNEMLREAVEQSGLTMERKDYPWTAETKANVESLLRCPVADYYYASDYYGAAYMRGQIIFYEKELSSDGYTESWKELRDFLERDAS